MISHIIANGSVSVVGALSMFRTIHSCVPWSPGPSDYIPGRGVQVIRYITLQPLVWWGCARGSLRYLSVRPSTSSCGRAALFDGRQLLAGVLQRPPTGGWSEKDIELVLSRAHMWRASFKDASGWQ